MDRLFSAVKQLQITIPKILGEYAIIAFADLDDFTTDDEGRLLVRPGVPKQLLRAVKKKKATRTERRIGSRNESTTEIELHDKLHALDRLKEHFQDLQTDVAEDAGESSAEAMKLLAKLLAEVQPAL